MDIAAIGELLIDFSPGDSPKSYVAHPGGAPANVLAQTRRLNKSAAFMGMVGEDSFGNYLRDALNGLGIDTSGLCVSKSSPTTLAFVHIGPEGDRSFTFYRHPGADQLFEPKDIRYELIDACRCFHFGGVSLSKDPMRSSTMQAARYAKKLGKTISFDPNYRALLWNSEDEAAHWMREGIALCDILKVSEDEAVMVTGVNDLEKAALDLNGLGPRLVFVTLGPRGCITSYCNEVFRSPTYDTRVVDTTGAGDSFLGAVLSKLLDMCELDDLSLNQLRTASDYGNAAGALTASAYGAIPALPCDADITRCTEACRLLPT